MMNNFFGVVAFGACYTTLWVVYLVYKTYKLTNIDTNIFQRNLLYLQSIGVSLGTMFILSSNVFVSIQEYFVDNKNPNVFSFRPDLLSQIQYITFVIAIQSFVLEQFSAYTRVFFEYYGSNITQAKYLISVCIAVELVQFITYSLLSDYLFINILIFAIADVIPHSAIIIIYSLDLFGKHNIFPGKTRFNDTTVAVEMQLQIQQQQQQQQQQRQQGQQGDIDLEQGSGGDAGGVPTKEQLKKRAMWGLIAVFVHLTSIFPLIFVLSIEGNEIALSIAIFIAYILTGVQFYSYSKLIVETTSQLFN